MCAVQAALAPCFLPVIPIASMRLHAWRPKAYLHLRFSVEGCPGPSLLPDRGWWVNTQLLHPWGG